MAEEEQMVELNDNFYRDSFGKVIFVVTALVSAILALVGLSLYLYLNKPPPVVFPVQDEWRVKAPVPLDQPYLMKPALLQWVAETLQKVFVLDFNHYNDQLKTYTPYFTDDGWKIFLNQLNIFANYNTVQSNKLFVNAGPAGAPSLINQGLLSGRYAWWVQMPITISYAGYAPLPTKTITLQVLVVRVSTLNNLIGVAINNIVVLNGTGS